MLRVIYKGMVRDIIRLMRVKHYIKNVMIMMPLFFGGLLFTSRFFDVFIGTLAFSFAASIVYIFNDLCDMEKDRLHPKKKNRPLASGKISKKTAKILIGGLSALSFSIMAGFGLGVRAMITSAVFIVINILYSSVLKNVPLLDVLILALGYVLRLYFGGVVSDIEISNWLFLTVMSLAFYLALGKRRNELMQIGNDSRPVLKAYTEKFLDKNMYLCLSLTLVFYSLWSSYYAELYNSLFVFTVPIVVIICMRYSMNIEGDNSSGDPVEVVLSDKILLGMVAFFATIVLAILYFL